MAICANTAAAPGIPQIFNADSSTLLFLPLAHSLARVIQLSCVRARVRIGYTPDVKHLAQDLQSFRPTLILAVPRVFEKLYTQAQRQAYAHRVTRIVFDRADSVAVAWSTALDAGGAGPALRMQHAIFDRVVYRQVRNALGGRVAWSVSGGAPLGARLGHFFRGVGVNVLEGYGLSETTTGGTLNLPGRQHIGSVGPPTPGCSVRIAEDGEILLHGDFVFDGYWHNEQATEDAISDDGWLRTGDIGEIDQAGRLYVRGRKKEMIVRPDGLNVFPDDVERAVNAVPGVRDSAVVGINDGTGERVHAVVVLETGATLDDVVRAANVQLAEHQRIRTATAWTAGDLPRTEGTRKLKRVEIKRRVEGGHGSSPAPSPVESLESLLARYAPGRTIGPGTRLDELGLSSLERVELMVAIEHRFQTTVDESAFSAARDVGELRHLIAQAPAATEQVKESVEFPTWNRSVAARIVRRGVLVHSADPTQFQSPDVLFSPATLPSGIASSTHT